MVVTIDILRKIKQRTNKITPMRYSVALGLRLGRAMALKCLVNIGCRNLKVMLI